MTMKHIFTLLVLVLTFATAAPAHEGKTHGAMIEGTVKSLTEDSLVVVTESGEVTVTLTSRTQLVDAEKRALERSELRPGADVMVAGSKLPGGGISATEVVVHRARPESPAGALEH